MDIDSSSEKYCVIGAGPSGLTAAKNLLQFGIACDCYEREDDVGGNWYYGRRSSSVIQSTHLISSKRLTEYTDYPMPSSWPAYPRHDQVLEYLRSYANHFRLYDHIRFNTSIRQILPAGEGWEIFLDDRQTPKKYQGIIIANGHHWDPIFPEYPGDFHGQAVHSRQYTSPEMLKDKRVLVVGAGNTGCDIAVEAAQNARTVFHSMRRGYHFLPKFLRGRPIDQLGEQLQKARLPLWLRRKISAAMVYIAQGKPQRYGLPRPDHQLFETHPIVNSQLLYFAGHGAIHFKPDLAQLQGDHVEFTDGSREEIDTIIYATGFKISFPFIDRQYLNERDGCPSLYLNVFHPHRGNLFLAGLIQPNSGLWGLVDLQSQLIARYLSGLRKDPTKVAWFQKLKSQGQVDLTGGIHYSSSPRHRLEVEFFQYRKLLKQLLGKFPIPPSRISAKAAAL